jgi:hypothetical protein
MTDAQFTLHRINFDQSKVALEPDTIDFTFAGHMFHEISNPTDLAAQVFAILKSGGTFTIFDYVSGNPELFVKKMVQSGMDETHARARYPHMCKHSVDDLAHFLSKAGFSDIAFEMTDAGTRAVVVGVKR